jgi:glycosyltransferase involved in cell wall biosynthesis
MAALVEEHRADIVHVHWTAPIAICAYRMALPRTVVRTARFLRGLAWLRARGIPTVWTVHNLMNHERRFAAIQRRVDRRLAAQSGSLFIHDEAHRAEVARTFRVEPERIVVIPHGHFADQYPDEIGRAEARRRLDLREDHRVVLAFGLVRPYKGALELIDAFESLDDRGARLLVVRAAHPRAYGLRVERRADEVDGVRARLERVPDDEVQVYMNAADVVALPFRSVLTSGSLILALTFGRPVVAADHHCAIDLVGDEGGILYDPEEPGALAAALRRVLALSPGAREAMGERNRAKARGLSWEEAAARTRAVYESLLGPDVSGASTG